MNWPRPLDPLRSFKAKTGLLVGASLLLASLTFWITTQWQFRYALLAALIAALVVTQILAHGMTSPLREMTAAAKAMATVTIRAGCGRRRATRSASSRPRSTRWPRTSRPTTGTAEKLIGNVSHELRTPIAALQAVLENVVDGVEEPDPVTMRSALAQTERLGGWSRTCWTFPGSRAARFRCAVRRSRSHRSSTTWCGRRRAPPGLCGSTSTLPPAGLRAVADSARLHQVITNLVDNAARHGAPDSPVRIRVRTDPHAGELLHGHPRRRAGHRRRRPLPGLRTLCPRRRPGRRHRAGPGDRALGRWSCTTGIEVVDTTSGCCIRLHCPSIREPIPSGRASSARPAMTPARRGRVDEEDTMSAPTLTPPHPVPTATCGTGTRRLAA